MKEKTKRPLGISIISVIGIISSICLIIIGIIFVYILFSSSEPIAKFYFMLVSPATILGGIFGLVLSIFLFRLKNWARIAIIILSVISLLQSIVSIPLILIVPPLVIISYVLGIIISIVLIIYLGFNKNVKEAFNKI